MGAVDWFPLISTLSLLRCDLFSSALAKLTATSPLTVSSCFTWLPVRGCSPAAARPHVVQLQMMNWFANIKTDIALFWLYIMLHIEQSLTSSACDIFAFHLK